MAKHIPECGLDWKGWANRAFSPCAPVFRQRLVLRTEAGRKAGRGGVVLLRLRLGICTPHFHHTLLVKASPKAKCREIDSTPGQEEL